MCYTIPHFEETNILMAQTILDVCFEFDSGSLHVMCTLHQDVYQQIRGC